MAASQRLRDVTIEASLGRCLLQVLAMSLIGTEPPPAFGLMSAVRQKQPLADSKSNSRFTPES